MARRPRTPVALHVSLVALLVVTQLAESSSTSLNASQVLDFSAASWTLAAANGSIVVPGVAVPGSVQEGLMQAGIIGDPLYRQNEAAQRWVAEAAWTLSACLSVGPDWLRGQGRWLLLDGLDSLVDVRLNGQLDFGWDWGPAVTPMGVHGAITLLSHSAPLLMGVHPQQHHTAQVVALDLECELLWPPSPPAPPPLALTARLQGLPGALTRCALQDPGQPGSSWVRMQLAVRREEVRLWWPRGLGPQPLYWLEVVAEPSGGEQLTPCTQAPSAATQPTCIAPPLPTPLTLLPANNATHPSSPGFLPPSCPLPPPPGPPPLAVRSSLLDPCGAGSSAVRRQLGFRSLDLVTQPLAQGVTHGPQWGQQQQQHATPPPSHRPTAANATDQGQGDGETFYFRVNGRPFFALGANLVPANVLHTRGTPRALHRLLRAARDAHMNMVRVWGGGLYQLDALYQWCDQQGLLVWQELMYACSPYPLTPDSLKEGVAEAQEQVRRLGGHASVALWGANNEVEASLDWFAVSDVRATRPLYASDMTALFSTALRQAIAALDPGRPYLDTSPTNGLYSQDPYIKRWGNVSDPRYGDVHYYNYWADCLDTGHYPTAKFVSEHGWQSAPSWHALKPYTQQQDWGVTTEGMRFRQRSPDGETKLNAQLARNFRLPRSWGNASQPQQQLPRLRSWMYLTQVQQALCYTTAFSNWRQLQTHPQALTMGILYWQLNDIWPGYSWSSLDYSPYGATPDPSAPETPTSTPTPGAAPDPALPRLLESGVRWKPSHYAVRRVFAPLAVLTRLQQGQLEVTLSSSVATSTSAHLAIYMVPMHASAEKCDRLVGSLEVTLGPQEQRKVWAMPEADMLALANCSARTCYANLELTYWLLEPTTNTNTTTTPTVLANSGDQEELAWWQRLFDSGQQQAGRAQHLMRASASGASQGVAAAANITGGASGPFTSDTPVWLARLKDMVAPVRSNVTLADFAAVGPREACFTVASAGATVPLLVLDTPLTGHFSDNLITLSPCRPRRLCFTWDAGDRACQGEGEEAVAGWGRCPDQALDLARLQASIEARSLATA
ncbi:glycoside hydrolase superfamily [Haematococcus lacustris]